MTERRSWTHAPRLPPPFHPAFANAIITASAGEVNDAERDQAAAGGSLNGVMAVGTLGDAGC
jgi:hypothetical protein